MKYLAFLLVAAPLHAIADWEARQGDDHVRFLETPCANELVLQNIKRYGMDPGKFQAATAFLQGQHYTACWTNRGIDVFLLYEDGDQGVVPRGDVKKVESI